MRDEIEIANSYVGIPYTEGGNSRAGCYCTGLVVLFVAEQFHTSIPDPASTVPAEVLVSPFALFFRELPAGEQPRFGDVAAMDGATGHTEGHLGVYIARGVLHATRAAGVIHQPLRRVRVNRWYRLKEYVR